MTQHVGIVACSVPGAVLCYQTICMGGEEALDNSRACPAVSMHGHPFHEYMRHVEAENWRGVADLMVSSAEKLACGGAEFCLTPCNTIHYALDMVASRSPLPWLHIAEEVAKEARRQGLQRIALLGTKLVMESRLYPDKFTEYGIEYVIPNGEERQCINRLVFEELVYGRFTNAARSYVTGVVERLRKEGSDAAGLCCTELPLLLKAEDTSLPLLDSTRILAIAALRRAAHGAEA